MRSNDFNCDWRQAGKNGCHFVIFFDMYDTLPFSLDYLLALIDCFEKTGGQELLFYQGILGRDFPSKPLRTRSARRSVKGAIF